MTHEISIRNAGNCYETKSFTFPGGELQVQIPGLSKLEGPVSVLARIQSTEDIIRLLLIREILDRQHIDGSTRLVVPYFPYARQDRVMAAYEAFSLKAVARLINSLGFDSVMTYDAHSDVTSAIVDNIHVVPQADIAAQHSALWDAVKHDNSSPTVVVAPDAGAVKKAFTVAQNFGFPLLTASKVRDIYTGAISRTELHGTEGLAGGTALIVDDICDGGRTFIELAKVLRANGAARVFLYVTHGIFSRGLGVFAGLIDAVFTTDSFLSEHIHDRLPYPPLHISPLQL